MDLGNGPAHDPDGESAKNRLDNRSGREYRLNTLLVAGVVVLVAVLSLALSVVIERDVTYHATQNIGGRAGHLAVTLRDRLERDLRKRYTEIATLAATPAPGAAHRTQRVAAAPSR